MLPSPPLQRALVILLAMIAGYVDGYGLLALSTYLSFMSGNTTQTGANLGHASFALALPSGIAIAGFLAGVFVGHLRRERTEARSNDGAPRATSGVRRTDSALLVAVGVMLVTGCLAIHFGWLSSFAAIGWFSVAMGLMNSAASRLGAEPINLTFVSGTLNRIGAHLALAVRHRPLEDAQGPRDTHARRALALTALWAAFLTGAAVAGFATGRLGAWTLLPPGIALLGAGALSRRCTPG